MLGFNHAPDLIDFVPPTRINNEWETDYKAMRESMIYGETKDFKGLIGRMVELRERFRKIKL